MTGDVESESSYGYQDASALRHVLRRAEQVANPIISYAHRIRERIDGISAQVFSLTGSEADIARSIELNAEKNTSEDQVQQ